jgi:thioredoxin reductase (NADPH)
MQKPVILAIDDDSQVASAVERDLRKQYRKDYRILSATSGEQALEAVKQLKQRNTPLALFLVDQRMPEMTGTEFLAEAVRYYPDARKVLLTAYADTQAAITSINTLGLDYYLMKPWDPPELNLYPVLDDMLSDWSASAPMQYEGIRVAGTLWSPQSHMVKDFLARNQIPYKWLDIERDGEAKALVESVSEERLLPVVFFEDGSYMKAPTIRDLAEKVGLYSRASQRFYDLLIVGGGPAGLAAAVYGASEGLRTLMVEKEATGGQAGTSSRIENYLGFPKGLSGADLARRATSQAKRLGAEIITGDEVVSVRIDGDYKYAKLVGGEEVSCHALVLAMGVSVRRLEIPGVESLTGAGVYYGAALTEAAYYREQDVFIVGGGNSAGQAAMYFSGYARRVYLIVRSSALGFGMSHYLVEQIEATSNIEVKYNADVVEAFGKNKLEAICLQDRDTGENETLVGAAMFIFIGAVPRTEIVAGVVERDRPGFILTGNDLIKNGKRPKGWNLKRDPYLLETSSPGIFAAGDVRHGSVKRVASAVGEGAVSIALVHQYLKSV